MGMSTSRNEGELGMHVERQSHLQEAEETNEG